MKKLILSITAAFIACSMASAQQVTVLKGTVMTQDSLPLIGALVMVNGGVYYATCDMAGDFSINKLPRRSVKLEISYLGYDTFKQELVLSDTLTNLGTIMLKDNSTEIGNVEISASPPIAIQNGDTTQYNALAFKTNPDADAGALIEKLPGIIMEDNKIEAMGETVKRIYVDGKLFFGDDVAEALANLPADAIANIQIFDDMTDEAKFTGVDDGEREKAINLVTKSKRNVNYLGRIEASGGKDTEDLSQNRYVLGGNITYFGKNDRITITGLMNNINLNKFAMATDDISADDIEEAADSTPDGVVTLNSLGVNYNRETKKMKLSLSYSLQDRSSEYDRTTVATYFPGSSSSYDTRNDYTSTTTANTQTNHVFNSRFVYYINKKVTLVLSPRITYRNSTYDSYSEQLIIKDSDSTSFKTSRSVQESDYFQLSGNLFLNYRISTGNSIATSISYNFNSNSTDRWQKQLERYDYKYNKDTEEYYWKEYTSSLSDKTIDQITNNNILNATITYNKSISSAHKLQFSILGGIDWGNTDKDVQSYDDDLEDYAEYSSQCSIFDRQYHNVGSKLGYTYKFNDFTLNAGAGYKLITQNKEEQKPTQYTGSYRFDEVSPYFNIRYSKLKTRFFRLAYTGKSILPNITQMQNVINDSSESYLKSGNPDLKQGYRHLLSLTYSASNIPKATTFNTTISGEIRENYIANSTYELIGDTVLTAYGDYVPIDGAFLTCPINMDGYAFARLASNYGFRCDPIRSNINISLKYSYGRVPSFYKELNYANKSDMSFRVGVSSNISENVDFNLFSNTSYTQTINTALDDYEYFKQNFSASLNVIFFTRIVFNTLVSARYEQSMRFNEYSYFYYPINTSLAYKFLESRKAEFRITAYDIFQQNKNLKQYQGTTAIRNTETSTIGRYVLARLSYKFNTMNSKKTAKKMDKAGKSDNKMNTSNDDFASLDM